jgi:hypothetical protein
MIHRFAVFGLALVLAGCAQQARPPQPVSTAPRPAPRRPEVPLPPAPPTGEPSAYVNLPPANLRGLLGQPAFVRQDGETEMWRYDGASCRAFFFFQGPKGSETVRHVETLPAGSASAADPLCLSALRAARPAT